MAKLVLMMLIALFTFQTNASNLPHHEKIERRLAKAQTLLGEIVELDRKINEIKRKVSQSNRHLVKNYLKLRGKKESELNNERRSIDSLFTDPFFLYPIEI